MKAKLPKGMLGQALRLFAALLVYENIVAPAASKVIAKTKGAKQ